MTLTVISYLIFIVKASVILLDKFINYEDQVDIEYISDKYNFSYLDNDNNLCEIHIFDDGIHLLKTSKDYSLQLNLRKKAYAIITTNEGNVKIDAKVVDFIENDDILVVRYIVDDTERQIRILYRSDYDS